MRIFNWIRSLFVRKVVAKLPREVIDGEYFATDSNYIWMRDLCKEANKIMHNDSFRSEVINTNEFIYTSDNGFTVYEKLTIPYVTVIRIYTSKNPWSSAIATTFTGDKENIYLNTRRNPRPMPEMVNTAIHERLHSFGYGHGSNSPVGKENSVNYKVGSIAEKYVGGYE